MTNIGIFGPGGSSSNPVYQEVACSEVSTNICFIVSGNSTVDNCFTETVYQNICTLVTIASDCSCNNNGYSIIENSVEVEVEGTTLTVYYKIKQLKDICPPTPPQPSSSCDIGDYWITKSGDDLIVEYEYSIIEDYGDYVDIAKATSSTTVACNNAGCKIEALSPTPTIYDDGNYHYPGSGGSISFSTSEETGELSATTVCSDKPIIFNFHGYPSIIHELAHRRHNKNIHVHGYREEGTITTPFDMRVQNHIDRYHIVMDALKYLDFLGNRGGALYQECLNKLVEHKEYISEHGLDMDVINNWQWKDINKD
jgi:hypothetical protein